MNKKDERFKISRGFGNWKARKYNLFKDIYNEESIKQGPLQRFLKQKRRDAKKKINKI